MNPKEPMTPNELSTQLADAVAAAGASVVRVEARSRASAGLVWAADLVLTAAHTLRREQGIQVGLPDGSSVAAELVGVDPATDLALLRVAAPLTLPEWRESADLRVGELVLALGRGEHGVRATLGLLSSLAGPWQTGHGARVDRWIEVDGQLPPGFSGGPLLDVSGRVIGMNSAALARGGSTLPVETLRRVAAAILSGGRPERGWLGVAVQGVPLAQAQAEVAGASHGVLLVAVQEGGPAARAGLQVGDVLLRLGAAPLTDARELQAALDAVGAEAEVSVRVLRGGVAEERTVRVGRRQQRGCAS